MNTAIVTGGAKGIGRAIVEELAKSEIKVIINYNTSEEEATQLKNDLLNKGFNIEIYKADVSKKQEVTELIKFAKEKFDEIDILINNAGIDQIKTFNDTTDEEWNKIIQTNLTSAFYCIKEVLPDMIKNKKGNIINISSIWGITGASCEVAYSVSKAGLNGLTKALAKELAPSNIKVNAIAPGAIMTDMNKSLTREEISQVNEEIPLGRFGKVEDIARCVKWLVEDNYTTGQIISVNGGWVI